MNERRPTEPTDQKRPGGPPHASRRLQPYRLRPSDIAMVQVAPFVLLGIGIVALSTAPSYGGPAKIEWNRNVGFVLVVIALLILGRRWWTYRRRKLRADSRDIPRR